MAQVQHCQDWAVESVWWKYISIGLNLQTIHHLFPRVPHYNLPALWQEMADDLVPKGVRAEGDAIGATGPIVW